MGFGQVGQHRKSGSRGGKGKAGGSKHFWIRTVKYEPWRFHKDGFLPPSALETELDTINVGELQELATKVMGAEGVKGGAELDLASLGIGRLLGRGSVTVPLKVKVAYATAGAKEKVEEAGGTIVEP